MRIWYWEVTRRMSRPLISVVEGGERVDRGLSCEGGGRAVSRKAAAVAAGAKIISDFEDNKSSAQLARLERVDR